MKDPKLFSAACAILELHAEAEARRLSRKYSDEWKKKRKSRSALSHFAVLL